MRSSSPFSKREDLEHDDHDMSNPSSQDQGRNLDKRLLRRLMTEILKNDYIITKAIVAICLISGIVTVILPHLYDLYRCSPWEVIYYAELYRLFTSAFVYKRLLACIVSLAFFAYESSIYERKWGVLVTFGDFFWKNLLINLSLIDMEVYIYPKFFDHFFLWGNDGLWGITYTYIISRLYQNPSDTTKYFNLPAIKNSHYFILYILVSLLVNRGVRPADLSAMMVGIIHAQILDPIFVAVRRYIYRNMDIEDREENVELVHHSKKDRKNLMPYSKAETESQSIDSVE